MTYQIILQGMTLWQHGQPDQHGIKLLYSNSLVWLSHPDATPFDLLETWEVGQLLGGN